MYPGLTPEEIARLEALDALEKPPPPKGDEPGDATGVREPRRPPLGPDTRSAALREPHDDVSDRPEALSLAEQKILDHDAAFLCELTMPVYVGESGGSLTEVYPATERDEMRLALRRLLELGWVELRRVSEGAEDELLDTATALDATDHDENWVSATARAVYEVAITDEGLQAAARSG